MSGYEDGGPLSLSEAVAEALGQLGPGALSDARAFVGALLDLADVDSAELRLLRAGLDDAALAPLAGLFESEGVLVRGRLEDAAEGIAGRMSREAGADPATARRAMGQVADGIKAYLEGRGAVWVDPEPPTPVQAEPLAQTEPEPPAQTEQVVPTTQESVVIERPVGPASESASSPWSQSRKLLLSGVAFLVVVTFVLALSIHHQLNLEIDVSFDGNGATSEMPNFQWSAHIENTAAYMSRTVTLPENHYVRDGYAFVGWSRSMDGSDAQQPGTEVLLLYHKTLAEMFKSRDVTFYAAWAPIATFDGNGGTGTMQPIAATGDGMIQLPRCTFEKPGYRFLGWMLGRTNNGMLVPEGEDYWITEPTVFYAFWDPPV